MTPIQNCLINKKNSNMPIWLMRQAGRYLPEFREIRKSNQNFICLLYTSPSPRDGLLSRMPSSA